MDSAGRSSANFLESHIVNLNTRSNRRSLQQYAADVVRDKIYIYIYIYSDLKADADGIAAPNHAGDGGAHAV